jgi:hypothetical protein
MNLGCSSADSVSGLDAGLDASIDVSVSVERDVTNFPGPDTYVRLPCNGIPAYCARKYDSLAYVTTHASAAYHDPPFRRFAQNEPVRTQLDRGVRALDFEFHENVTGAQICYGDCAFGEFPAAMALQDVAAFFADNPREVVTVLVEYASPNVPVADAFRQAGLDKFAFVHDRGTPWPTLDELIASGRRLVVLTLPLPPASAPPSTDATPDQDAELAHDAADARDARAMDGAVDVTESGAVPDPGPVSREPWLNDFLEEGAESPRGLASMEDLECTLVRGAQNPELVLLHHWLRAKEGSAWAKDDAAVHVRTELNAPSVLQLRLERCAFALGRPPNYVAVDFYEIGGVRDAVQALNLGQ